MMDNKLNDKLAKMIALAESTTHPEEADAFMQKVHDLLEANGLRLQDIGEINEKDPVEVQKEAYVYSTSISGLRDVVFRMANYYGCNALMTTKRGLKNKKVVHLIGRESGRIAFILMMPYIIKQVRKMARELHKEEGGSLSTQMGRINKALDYRLWKIINERKKQAPKGLSGENALVPVDKIKTMQDEAFPKVGVARKTKTSTTLSAIEKANKINLNDQVAKKNSKVRMIS